MQESTPELNDAIATKAVSRRRKLLPWWVLTFTWLFMVFGAVMPVAVIMGLLRYRFQISLLGFGTNDPLSFTGIFLILLFAFKGAVAFGLWTEKKWAVRLAKADAIISIIVCCLAMIIPFIKPNILVFSFRLELIVIIPYLYKMRQIQYDWDYFNNGPVTAESDKPGDSI